MEGCFLSHWSQKFGKILAEKMSRVEMRARVIRRKPGGPDLLVKCTAAVESLEFSRNGTDALKI